ncbi:MAG: hypothetical protein ACFFCZ_03720 [Promethearchaeota archaeon]
MRFSSLVALASTSGPLEIRASPEVSMTNRISIRISLASASAVVERRNLMALASGSSLCLQGIPLFRNDQKSTKPMYCL